MYFTKDEDEEKPIVNKVIMTAKCWQDIMGWCKAANSEVSGLGLVDVDKEGQLKITQAFLLKQVCSSAHSELDATDMASLMADLNKKKVPLSKLKFWWHTHYNFNVFWSGTDDATCSRLVGASKQWSVAVVVNQSGDYKSRLDLYNPIRFTAELDLEVENEEGDLRGYKKDIDKKVSSQTYGYAYGNWGGFNKGHGNFGGNSGFGSGRNWPIHHPGDSYFQDNLGVSAEDLADPFGVRDTIERSGKVKPGKKSDKDNNDEGFNSGGYFGY